GPDPAAGQHVAHRLHPQGPDGDVRRRPDLPAAHGAGRLRPVDAGGVDAAVPAAYPGPVRRLAVHHPDRRAGGPVRPGDEGPGRHGGATGMTRRQALLRGVGIVLVTAFVITMPYDMKWAGSAFALDYGVIIGMIVLSVSVLGWIGEFTLAVVAQMGFGLVVVNLLQDAGMPFLVIIPVVIVSPIPISILLGVFV